MLNNAYFSSIIKNANKGFHIFDILMYIVREFISLHGKIRKISRSFYSFKIRNNSYKFV